GITCFGQDTPSSKEYRDFALRRDGNADRGRELFYASEKTACSRCHSVDGTAGKAGPDLYAVGDKFPRRELIQAILEPSETIAIGYGATLVETKAGEEVLGVIKQATDTAIELMTGDGRKVSIPTSEITAQRGSTVSLMPEGLHSSLTREEFADLIGYLA